MCFGFSDLRRDRGKHPPSVWSVRTGPNYKKHKRKQPSEAPLFDMVAFDGFRTDHKVTDAGCTQPAPPD